ncbi:family 1 encapsulin nanocompartment shell protein [Draconibacterium halophilum]|uniref:Bacteriocin family protein n=1 Tax=Draconibacterium halophilum TaxID=2706887 RepID=A0A6C0RGH0_9BACT|nr:family 1 encapsulin nanocompartment shell protein [Draconibacterium halophilum]QIA09086.1 bacteriocin family protein [Draconibacterium halophilum]
MNILRKSLAPVSEKAWSEITTQAKQILGNYSTARKFADINGPNGLEMGGISTGRLDFPKNQPKEGVNYGVREFLPLTEVRKPFELDLWELDNIERGAIDIDLSPLEKAARELAVFEEKAIYEGFQPAKIIGLEKAAEGNPVSLPADANAFLKEIGNQIIHLDKKAVQGPYTLVINEMEWLELIKLSEGYPIQKQLKDVLGGNVLINHFNKNSFLLSERGGDYELVIGQDYTLGYDSHTTSKVKLFLTGSFTFRVLSPEAIVVLTRSAS